jgi:hypothetical protein
MSSSLRSARAVGQHTRRWPKSWLQRAATRQSPRGFISEKKFRKLLLSSESVRRLFCASIFKRNTDGFRRGNRL